MKHLHMIFLVLALSAGAVSAAYADCHQNGKPYPTGTVRDGFVCTPDGRWVKQ